MSQSDFTAKEKAGICEAYREFKEARSGTVDGLASVKSFMSSDYFQWNGTIEEIYTIVIGRQSE